MGQNNSKQEENNKKKRENFRNISRTIKSNEKKNKAVIIESFDDFLHQQEKIKNQKNNNESNNNENNKNKD